MIRPLTIEQQYILKKRKLGTTYGHSLVGAAIWPIIGDGNLPPDPPEPIDPDNYFKGFQDTETLFKYLTIKDWNVGTGLSTGVVDFNTIEGIYGPTYPTNGVNGHITYIANGDGTVSVYESNGIFINSQYYTVLTTITECEQYINTDVPGIVYNNTNQIFNNSDKVYSLSHSVPGTYTPLEIMNTSLTLSISNMGPFDCSDIEMTRDIAFFWRGQIPYNNTLIDIGFNPHSIAINYWQIGLNMSFPISNNQNSREFIPGKYPPKTGWYPAGPLAATYPNSIITLSY